MKTPYLDREIELLEGFKDKKEASFYQLRKLAEYREIKQLIIHSVGKSILFRNQYFFHFIILNRMSIREGIYNRFHYFKSIF